MRRWLLILVLIGLAGCATSVSQERKSAMRNVAVVSAIGDDVTLFRILGFSKEQPERLPWSFDKLAGDAVVQSIRARNPNISIVPVDYDPNVLSAGIHRYQAFQSYADPTRIEPVLRQLTSGKAADTIILIARNSVEQSGLLTYQGVGIVTEVSALQGAPITPFAALSLFVIDVPTMQVLSRQTMLVKGRIYNVNPLIPFEPIGGPAPFLPGFKFPMTEEQKEFLRPILQGQVSTGARELTHRSGF